MSCREKRTSILRTRQTGQVSLTVPSSSLFSQHPPGTQGGRRVGALAWPCLLGQTRQSTSLGLGSLAWRGALPSEVAGHGG